MNTVGFAPILTALCLLSSLVMIIAGTWRSNTRRKRNRRIGLPSPACERFPAWNANVPLSRFDAPAAQAELPGMMRRQAD